MDASASIPNPSPSCPGCAEYVRQVGELKATVAALQDRLDKAEVAARAAKRQAAPFSKGPPKSNPKPPGRKSGDQYGSHHRRAVPPTIDEVIEVPLPATCQFCNGVVVETGIAQQYQTEIPRKPIHRQFNVHIGECAYCHKPVQGRHPLQTSDALGAAASQLGPDAQVLAVQLNKEAGLSHGKISRFFKAAFDIDVSRAGVCRTMLRVAKRCEPAYQQIIQSVQHSPTLTPDETGWRIGGKPGWLHVAVGNQATAYLVHRKRGFEAMVELIGVDYDGFMTHDGWSPYEKFIDATHQTCLSHLLRRAHELKESAAGAGVLFPRQAKAILQESLAVRDRRDAGELTLGQTREQAEELSRRMADLVCRPRANADNETFAKHLFNHQSSLFTFLQFEGVDATNYKAEQAIRPATVNRKVWGGNRTEIGATAQSVLMSVIRTTTQRGMDTLAFLSSTIKSVFGQHPQIIPDTG